MSGMKFDPSACPKCGGAPRGTFDSVQACAEFEPADDGGFEFSGHTEVYWDTQETQTEGAKLLLVCISCGEEWPAERVDEEAKRERGPPAEGAPSPGTPTPAPDPAPAAAPAPMRLGDAMDTGNVPSATFVGVVVDVRDSSGLVLRCPECTRTLAKGACRVHGKTKGEPDLRIKAVLDDGTAAVIFVLDQESTERLMGTTLADAQRKANEAGTPDVVRDDIENRILGRTVELRGALTADEFGYMLMAEEARFTAAEVG